MFTGDSQRSELRIFPGNDGGYAIPEIVSSGVATSIRGSRDQDRLSHGCLTRDT